MAREFIIPIKAIFALAAACLIVVGFLAVDVLRYLGDAAKVPEASASIEHTDSPKHRAHASRPTEARVPPEQPHEAVSNTSQALPRTTSAESTRTAVADSNATVEKQVEPLKPANSTRKKPIGRHVDDSGVASANTETTAESQMPPRPFDPTVSSGHANYLEQLTKISSNQYSTFGYGDYRLGASVQEVNDSPATKGTLYETTSGFVRDESNNHFWFDNGRLRVIRKVYEGNSQEYIAELVTVFGKTRRENVFRTSYVDPIYESSTGRVDAFHYFPKTIVCISVIESTSEVGSTSLVVVEVFDKEWLLQQFEKSCHQMESTLKWVVDNVEPGQLKSLSALPVFLNTSKEHSAVGERHELKWELPGEISELLVFKANKEVFLYVERFAYPNRFDNDRTPPSGSLRVRIDFANYPGPQNAVISRSSLVHLAAILARQVVQTYIPPDSAGIHIDQNSGGGCEFYSWRSKLGWTVEVGSDWLGLITKRVQL